MSATPEEPDTGDGAAVDPAWDPEVPGWNHTIESDGTHRFSSPSTRPLRLGHVPDGTKISVDYHQRHLTIHATPANNVTLAIDRPLRQLDLDGEFHRVHVDTRANCQLTVHQRLGHLVLGPGVWDLRNSAGVIREIELQAADQAVSIAGGSFERITGNAGLLRLDTEVVGRPNVDIDGILMIRRNVELDTVECTTLHLEGQLAATVVAVHHTGSDWAVHGKGSLKADRLISHGPTHVGMLEVDEVHVTGGPLVASQTAPDAGQVAVELMATSPVDDDESPIELKLTPPTIPDQGTITARTLTVEGGGVHGHNINIAGGATQVEISGLLSAATLIVPAGTHITTGGLLVQDLAAVGSTITATAIHITGNAEAEVLSASTVRVDGTSLKVRDLTVHAAVLTGTITASTPLNIRDHLHLHTGANVTGGITLNGAGVLETDTVVCGLIDWHPAASDTDAVLQTNGSIEQIHIDGSDHQATLTGHRIVPKRPLRITGDVAIRPTRDNEQGKGPVRVRTVECHDGHANLQLIALSSQIEVESLTSGVGNPRVSVTTAGDKLVQITIPESLDFRIDVNTETTVTIPNSITSAPEVRVRYSGARQKHLTITGTVAHLESIDSAEHLIGPFVSLPPGTMIEDCAGDIRLALIGGTIICSRSPRARWRQHRSSEPSTRPVGPVARLTGSDSMTVERSARIDGLDVTELLPSTIANLGDAEVLDPDPTAIRRYAQQEHLDSRDIKVRAQWMLTLHTALETKSISGTTKSAVAWAAARLQHRSTWANRRSEWFWRTAHRALGYGHKIWPPFALWVASAAFITMWAIDPELTKIGWCEIGLPADAPNAAAESACVTSWGDMSREFARSLFFPFRLFRLSPGETVFRYLPDWSQPIAGLTIGIPFIVMLLATRRFFTLSHDN